MSNLTPKQLQILEWIEHYLNAHHTMPSRREIAEGLGLSSPATIQQHIEALEKKGFLKRGETRESRALQWTPRSKKMFSAIHTSRQQQPADSPQASLSAVRSSNGIHNHGIANSISSSIMELPLLGSIAAGYPIEVFPEARNISIPLDLFVSRGKASRSPDDIRNYYVLTVRGDSMIDEGIFQNDLIILKRANQAKTGDTVAALINGEATLKRFIKSKTAVELHPANPRYPVIQVRDTDRFEIQGILVGVIRRF